MEESAGLVRRLGALAVARGLWVATAESCTGGLVAGTMTAVPGSSAWFRGGVVAYANEVKTGLLGVPEAVLRREGAVSGPCVEAMAYGVAQLLGASAAVAVSGIAGPGGGSPEKPVGVVWIGWSVGTAVSSQRFVWSGRDRAAVRWAAVEAALAGLVERLEARDSLRG